MKKLTQRFIKNADNTSDPLVRAQYGALAGGVGIIVNVLLFGMKFFIGSFTNSIAITADAFNNLSDAGSSVVTLVGFHMSNKPADKEHPFGHGRIEYISGMVIAFLILLVGFQLFMNSVEKIFHPEEVQTNLWAVAVLIVSMAAKLLLGLFYRGIGKKIHSASLKAAMTDSISDVAATGAVLISVLIFLFSGFNADGIMGAIVAVIVFIAGIKALIETLNPLLGQAPDHKMVMAIKEKVLSYDGVLGLHDLIVHNYGPGHWLASLHVEVSADEDILKSHDLIDTIEHEVGEAMDISVVIHMDPIVTSDEQMSEVREQVAAIIREVDERLSFHDFRMVAGITHTNLIFDVLVPYNFSMSTTDIKTAIIAKIKNLSPSYYAVITIDKSYV